MDKNKIVDWGLLVSIVGLFLGIFSQSVQIHERITKIETTVQSETVLCDCFATRNRVGVLEHREDRVDLEIQRLNARLDKMENE